MKRDANHGTIALCDALEGYEPDTAIYCLATQLSIHQVRGSPL